MREQRGGECRTATGKAREMPEAEVKETVEVKLPEQQPEEIKPQDEEKKSARVLEMSDEPKLESEVLIELEKNNAKPDEKAPAAEAKEVEQEKTQVLETLVSGNRPMRARQLPGFCYVLIATYHYRSQDLLQFLI